MQIQTQTTASAIVRKPAQLVPLIKAKLKEANVAAEAAAQPHYAEIGAMMIEAKAGLAHGQFQPWLKRHFSVSQKHAARYMAYARATDGGQNSRYENFSDFMRKDGGDAGYGRVVRRKDWHEPVRDVVDAAKREAERIRDEELTRAEERDAQRKLGLRLIDIGFKVLSKELHPDAGGSREAMTRLNAVRSRLKDAV